MNKYIKLKQLINNSETLVVPDAYDGISAKIIESVGFKSVQCSGYSFSISKKYKSESIITLEENLSITKNIVGSVTVPVFADGEDGYGCEEIFLNNISKFVSSGIAGINIEDQNLWNSYNSNRLLPEEESIKRIKTIKKHFPELIVNARTDAINVFDNRTEGINTAIKRANKYIEAGADLCFTTGVKTKEEINLLNNEIVGPLSIAAGLPYNINNFDINDCKEAGIARVSLPSIMIYSSIKAQLNLLQSIKQNGCFDDLESDLVEFKKLNELLD